jgi:hypothetical protein
MNWRQEQEALENAYARALLIEYGIKEVTSQRQAKNGTREFEFPVKPKYSKKPLRLACLCDVTSLIPYSISNALA